jgi:hypothetical protein
MPQYISVSRRNDIPRFFYRQFFSSWRQGEITYDAGYGRRYTVSLKQKDVLGFIFWSKDFSSFLAEKDFRELIGENNAIFHYTINDCPELEPGVAPLESRLKSLRRLAELVGPERIVWRFDPICKYSLKNDEEKDNAAAFFSLLPRVREMGINRCHFSFISLYKKLLLRNNVRFLPIPGSEKLALAAAMLQSARAEGLDLYCCCDERIIEQVRGIGRASCVDQDLLEITDRFGRHRKLNKKPTRDGCGCCESRDIGSYSRSCPHGCLYCYANPALTDSELWSKEEKKCDKKSIW